MTLHPCFRSIAVLPLLCGLVTPFAGAETLRDPFWPIGYAPAPPEPPEKKIEPPPEKPAAKPVKPLPEPEKPVTAAAWLAARDTLAISGFTRSTRPDTGETRVLVMINRHSFAPGDTLCVTNQGIAFRWRIAALTNQTLDLAEVEARRLKRATPRQHAARNLSTPDLPSNPQFKGVLK